ncbi:MAG TPA: prepilin-type N-terminal cleavage/methylation domain-containing protein [Alphaproteobacteria bacterium]|jgi:general secretion pathway protein J|nr:prepilin-type N-terminal cleavage/methylation domain-containing protein [Alphaproteobacteria bacterium]
MPPRRRSQGFTLVELLIAITLFALLSTLLFGSLRFGTRATDSGTARMERTAELATATNFLRNQLSDAQPLPMSDGGNQSVAFDGEPDSLEFVGLPPAYLAPGGWHVLQLVTEKQGRRSRLMLRMRLIFTDGRSAAVSDARSSVLLDHVKMVEFAYFGALENEEKPEWHERWQGAPHLPRLVRLRITFADGEEAPDLIIALRPAPPPLS